MADRSLVVRPSIAGEVPQEDLDRLGALLREEGYSVRVGYGEFPFVPEEDEEYADAEAYLWFETVCFWFAQGAVTTLGGATALAAVKMMRDRFKKESDEGDCVRCVELVEDQGDEGKVLRIVQIEGAEAKPVVRDLGELEGFTRKKPSDLID